METVKKEGRYLHLDILRIIGTLAVILIHVAAQNWTKVNVKSFEWGVFNFYDSLVRWGVPIFTMVSGALFLGRDLPTTTIYKKYILRIVTAFLFWSSIYALPILLGGRGVKAFLIRVGKGPYHLWFLFMIVGLYMIIPFLKKIAENETLLTYFLRLSFFFAFVIPQTIGILQSLNGGLAGVLREMYTDMHMDFVTGYAFYYLLGYYLNQKKEIKMGKVYLVGGIGFLSTFLFTALFSMMKNKPNELFYEYFSVNVLFESIFIFLMVRKIFVMNGKKTEEKVGNFLKKLSKYSFGAYLVHVLILNNLRGMFKLHTLTFHPVFAVLLVWILVTVLSFLVSALLNRIPKLNQYIV